MPRVLAPCLIGTRIFDLHTSVVYVVNNVQVLLDRGALRTGCACGQDEKPHD